MVLERSLRRTLWRANETRFAIDVPDVITWIRGGDLPRTVRDASFSPTRLLTIQSRLSAAYKGLMACS